MISGSDRVFHLENMLLEHVACVRGCLLSLSPNFSSLTHSHKKKHTKLTYPELLSLPHQCWKRKGKRSETTSKIHAQRVTHRVVEILVRFDPEKRPHIVRSWWMHCGYNVSPAPTHKHIHKHTHAHTHARTHENNYSIYSYICMYQCHTNTHTHLYIYTHFFENTWE